MNALAVTPDGSRILSGWDDNIVRVMDLESGRLELELAGHTSEVKAVAVTPDGARMVSGSTDGTVRVWDPSTGQEVARWAAELGVAVHSCCVVPTDPSLVVYGDSAGGVHVLRLVEDRPPAPAPSPPPPAPAPLRRFSLLKR